MKEFQPVLLKVWQEACRHIEISEMTQNIAPLLLRDMPLDQILVRSIHSEEESLETVAIGFATVQHIQPATHNKCPGRDFKKLIKWCSRGEFTHWSPAAGLHAPLCFVVPKVIARDIIAGPLGSKSGCRGVLVLIARQDQKFNARHLALAQALIEPFSVARENDHRLHELAVLREAAEADKVSLLKRLGRNDIEEKIIGSDSGLSMVMARVEQVSHLNVPVLIMGETGSGKELIARAIHKLSNRRDGAFIRVNCGAIPAELIDSQLFGHERGAFTGATETRKGWFERADGGTLFLDEIGELSAAAQVRLLRILQDGWLERVGGQHQIHVDVRIVAATHRNLAAEVEAKKFREDLWYRIAVFPIRLPSLCDRKEDIPELARYCAERAANRFGLRCVMPAPEEIRLLTSYSWPGNVRELAAVIDRAAILGDGKKLEIAKALGTAENSLAAPEVKACLKSENQDVPVSIIPLDEAIRRHLEAALQQTEGRIEGARGAAAILKSNPSTLRAQMRRLHIDWRKFRSLPHSRRTSLAE